MLIRLKDLKNRIDFSLRNRLHFGRRISSPKSIPARDGLLQNEFREFLKGIPWKHLLEELNPSDPIEILDIGARNFAFGPVLDRHFQSLHFSPHIHGIEIDAHRLLAGFYSRKSYGEYYASQMSHGSFHAIDFLTWDKPADIIFLLNPFVSEEPTVSWGLPLNHLRPQDLFKHCAKLMRGPGSRFILSCPSPEELEIAKELAEIAGFSPLSEHTWHPKGKTVQQKSRYGIVYESKVKRGS